MGKVNTDKVKLIAKVGAGAIALVGGALIAKRASYKGKRTKTDFSGFFDSDILGPMGPITGVGEPLDPFRPETFASTEQADAYSTLLKLFNGNTMELSKYIWDRYYGSHNYTQILEEYKLRIEMILKESEKA